MASYQHGISLCAAKRYTVLPFGIPFRYSWRMAHALAPLVAAWRLNNGLTQKEAAERIGITQATLSRIESGVRWPDDDTARLLIEAAVLTQDELAQAFVTRVVRPSPTEAAA